ncbi:MAG TPA: winged helix-turn-helix domain-containing protein [Candidatus Hypogeohydataceae bacterium YC41]
MNNSVNISINLDSNFYDNFVKPVVERFSLREPLTPRCNSESETLRSFTRLKLLRTGSMARWGDQLLPITGKHFDILLKLAQRPGKIVIDQDLYALIDSEFHKDPLLRQYIKNIRKTFPSPYNDHSHPEGIIKTRKMEGYYLNLSPDRVEMV